MNRTTRKCPSTRKFLYILSSALGQLFPSLTQLFPSPSRLFPSLSQLFPSLRQLFPSPTLLFLSPSQLFPSPSQLFPSPSQLFLSFSLLIQLISSFVSTPELYVPIFGQWPYQYRFILPFIVFITPSHMFSFHLQLLFFFALLLFSPAMQAKLTLYYCPQDTYCDMYCTQVSRDFLP